MTTDIIIIVSTVIAILVTYALLLWNKLGAIQKKIETREEEKKYEAKLSLQREKYENLAYIANEKLVATYVRFTDVNHLLIANEAFNLQLSENPIDDSFFKRLSIDIKKTQVEDGYVSCLMPFNSTYNKVFDTIKQTTLQLGLTCHRSDEQYVPGSILKYTIEMILKSQVIIAVLDGRNANVYYEVGIAHSIGKPVILVSNASKIKNIPFDIGSNRIILYKNQDSLRTQLSTVLTTIYKHD